MTSSEVAMLVVIIVLLLVSVFLAMAETALTRMTRSKAQALAEEGRWGSARLLELVSHPERFLNGSPLTATSTVVSTITIPACPCSAALGPAS